MTTTEPDLVWLNHGRSRLALHRLRDGEGPILLVLHGLGEESPATLPAYLEAWPGPVHALDLTGHGASTRPAGGGYTAELMMADVDAAVAHLGPVTVFGRGLGGYLALLIGGGRPCEVRGVIVADGPGLVGGGIRPATPSLPGPAATDLPGPDPLALVELSRDVRPPDYAAEFVRQMVEWSGLEHPVSVCALVRPEWLVAVLEEPGVTVSTLAEALARYAGRD